MSNKITSGICYLVGAGPGDPGLVTLRAKECIERADVLVYDYLCNPEILGWAKPEAEKIYAGKKARQHTLPQPDINQLLVEKTKEGKTVTRLKGGDPFVFGRGAEEAAELAKAGLRFEIVPGISSAIAGPAYAGIPVTHRAHNSVLTIYTGHEDPAKEASGVDYKKLAEAEGVKVMLMGVERIGEIAGNLMDEGASADTPAALVRWATTGRQETLSATLGTIAKRVEACGFKPPAVAVFGGVVGLRKELNWFESRPLFGRRIAVTRTRQQAGALTARLRDLGADVIEMPTIRIEPPVDPLTFGRMVQDAHTYNWIVFTSPNGVDAFFDLFFKLYEDARAIGGCRIAAIGPGTAQKIKARSLAVDLQPEKFVAEGLVEAFGKVDPSIENLTVLWVRAEQARDIVGKGLWKLGAIVDEGIAYRTVAETGDPTGAQARFKEEGADIITFTSSSTVENFIKLNLPLPDNLICASIGPVTSATMRANGLEVDIEAERHDIPGLVEAIRLHFGK